ncbi:Pkinase-domain-containing protein [Venustampulla echinocandica]|uniref:Serine/threonine-protein kinase ATG1 n=1 Tax=Venustampulla echinocandica TaxID=2656787 RepID=A0A370U0V3_9HELO|nr:Pkinase-domain-containing protein [Venustampulla echinocandica]RDL41406.1 Pkinase-domain-containing protein [Venustampulla echinocandica]
MAALPPPSSSSSSRRTRTGDKVVGSFTIEDEIGKGSFATVYRGTHKATGALVAIKSVNLLKLNKKLKDNLYCEIEILKGLHHPHIVALIDCRESSSHIHLVMEYCELGDLSYFIKKRDKLADNPALKDMVRKYPMPPAGGLNEVIVRHFLKQLASAMEFLRDRNFIHRDVKPQNLLLLPSPQYIEKSKDPPLIMSASEKALVPMVGLTSLPMLKIADFGFARSLPSTSLAETLCGSPLYMAPEILRYEKYDAKADLWSVGTVLYEMMTGRPPFRATNHVELLRKIEQSEDHIRFPREAVVSSGMKDLIKALLKRTPVERIEFDNFFNHLVVKEPIPGLVGDDRPSEIRAPSKGDEASISRTPSTRTDRRQVLKTEVPAPSSSPRERPTVPSSRALSDPTRQVSGPPPRHAPQPPTPREQKRPSIIPSATAPNPEYVPSGRPLSRTFNPAGKGQRGGLSAQSSTDDVPKHESATADSQTREAIAEAEQAVRDAREYVLVEKRAVEVNAFADEMAANPRLQGGARQTATSKGGQIARRATTQGVPSSTTGAVPASPSRAVQIAQGKPRQEAVPRRNSVGKSYGSPSATSAIAKALHGASVRVFGVGWSPHLIGKGMSPPQLYSPFPAYPAPHGTIGLLGDGRPSGPVDEDQKAVNIIEESATRSDVVYGFAEVKYKQLIPLAPSMDHGLGGPPDKSSDSIHEDEGLTVEAVVVLSEEALVLYVKALSLLAKSMDIAGAWWTRKSRGEIVGGSHRAESATSVAAGNRINSAVQWVRSRFNEVLEKAEFVRLKLIEAQKQLPEDHPGHPSNHTSSSRIAGASSTDGVVLSSGISAEKLMYDRAIEMSRTAAINEIANEDLSGCEISYITALRMLEAVLENDDVIPQIRRSSGGSERDIQQESDAAINGIKVEDREAVQKVTSMIRTRLTTLRKKMAMIAKHQSLPPSSPRLSTVSYSSGTTPTVANTPPH